MDNMIIIMACFLSLVCYASESLRGHVHMGMSIFSWVIATPILLYHIGVQMRRLDSVSLWQWTGTAEIGLVSLAIVIIGLCLFMTGGRSGARRLL